MHEGRTDAPHPLIDLLIIAASPSAVFNAFRLGGARVDGRDTTGASNMAIHDEHRHRVERRLRGGNEVPVLGGCLHELFEAQVDLRGNAPALMCGDLVLSYAELDERANKLAHHLRSMGVHRGNLIGLCLKRSEKPIIAILACLKAGAAYVPIDPTHPDDRIRYIIEEAELSLVICEEALARRISSVFDGELLLLDRSAAEIAAQLTARLARIDTGITSDDLCYVIYTSGTTGRPKGVMTEHRNAHHFVLAFNTVCMTSPSDRVYQGFSLGFDGSVEEIWMAFSNGATLVVGSNETPRFGNDLAQYLSQAGVTYLSTVPTMLSTIADDVATLRQLVISGEACPSELVERWARPGRLILNVYGPTEATVNATAKVCIPGKPITIGRAIAGYSTLILDSEMRPLPPGAKGELYIGGAGVSRGYLKQIELTSRHFVHSPYCEGRIYRTGDLAAINNHGELEFFGRIDDQVKVRGFRVELSEITSVLLAQQNVAAAAVTPITRAGVPILAAYIVLQDRDQPINRSLLLSGLKAKLPAYMVPSYLDVVDELPMLTTGKVDRKRLPEPILPLVEQTDIEAVPMNPREAKIAETWAALFGVRTVDPEQDFFLDLGGHSLLAAQMVTLLRSRADLHIAVRDVYAFPTVRKLAEHLAVEPARPAPTQTKPQDHAPPLRREAGVGIAALQALLLVVSWYLVSTPILLVLPVADDFLRDRISMAETILALFLIYVAIAPLTTAVAIGAKWLIIGRYKPGAYPLWGSYYIRCWLAGGLQRLFSPTQLIGTPLMPVYYRLMGAKVGSNCALGSALVSAWDLVSVGNDTSIGADTQMQCARVENGYLILGRIDIGSRCFVGSHSAFGLNVRMGDDSRIDDQSFLPDGANVPAEEQRRGSPAERSDVPVATGPIYRASFLRRTAFVVFAWLLSSLTSALVLAPGLAILILWQYAFQQGWALAFVWITAALMPILITVACLWVVVLKTILLRRAKPGIYRLYSFYYLRHWLAYGLMRWSRNAFLPIFTTVYLPPWMRLLGAKIGRYAEMSTVWSFMPELLNAGESTFFADGCMLGGRRVFGGRFEIRINRIGNRSFIGNGALMSTGASLGNNCLLGVLSAPPSNSQETPDGTDWLGSPAFQLPNRQKIGGFDERVTYHPSHKLYFQRALVDALRVLIPSYTAFFLGVSGIAALLYVYEVYGMRATFAIMPVLGVLAAAIAVAIVVGLKWAVMGRFKPVIVPLWSPYVWFNEMVNGAYESIMVPIVALFFGTPFAAPLLRLLGCKIGRHCYIGTALFSEFDLVQIDDFVALNAGAVIQNHLFEDRVMKSSNLTIERGCSVGNMSVVLYDSQMQEGAMLGPLSLLMKGEVMPTGSRWHGIPTV
jgi:non-ribosomal peptide synthetase-like protein